MYVVLVPSTNGAVVAFHVVCRWLQAIKTGAKCRFDRLRKRVDSLGLLRQFGFGKVC